MTASDGTAQGMSQQELAALVPVPEKRPTTTLDRPIMELAEPVLGNKDERMLAWFQKMGRAWDEMPEEIKDAMILMERAFPGPQNSVYHLTPPQALMIVRYCHEKGIGVHSDTWWFDNRNYRVGSTVSGLRQEARAKGLDLGAPVLRPITRPWPQGKAAIPGYAEDVGYHCEIAVGSKGAPASCDVWLSSAFQPKSSVWQLNADHMLQVRAIGTCTKFAMGSGISQMPEDLDDKEETK